MNKLDSLKNITNVMADTSDIEDIRRYQPHDVTTNPSSILRFVEDRKNSYFIKDIFSSFDFRNLPEKEIISDLYNIILVKLTLEILKIVPGRISIEIDSRFSYDEDYCFTKSKDVIHKLEKEGIQRDRVLIKIAATWQGIQADWKISELTVI
ncbi:transaldolase family protein [Candidatus Riesia pediculischaeffi]|uniref:Uncharacterized protein n=1 Tax=Candidatus Riesia pediculischaeffi TaxID=428411 RepID=A0A1V0HJY8_9ENTR|nr:transaldolase family protein [Candidatus Riesia pediculischaeffi]ARC53140.1 hypothetical protein AOQ87_00240 [Candidatus Riesia pediculischaeffi]